MEVDNHDHYVIFRSHGTVLTYVESVIGNQFQVAQVVSLLNSMRRDCPSFHYVEDKDWIWGSSSEYSDGEQAKLDWINKHIQ